MADTIDARLILRVTDDDGGVSIKRSISAEQISESTLNIHHVTLNCSDSEVSVDLDPEDVCYNMQGVLVYNYDDANSVYIGIATGSYFGWVGPGKFSYLNGISGETLYLLCNAGLTATVEIIGIGVIT